MTAQYKLEVGEKGKFFICDDCAYRAKIQPKYPADSGSSSWLCDKCNHFNIGSYMVCEMGEWLVLQPIKYTEGGSSI